MVEAGSDLLIWVRMSISDEDNNIRVRSVTIVGVEDHIVGFHEGASCVCLSKLKKVNLLD